MSKSTDGADVVLHVVTSLGFGGVEKHMETLARAGNAGSCRHHFCALGVGGATAERIKAMDKAVHVLNQSTGIPNPRAILALHRVLNTVGPTIVHTHGVEANFHGLIAAGLAGVPVRVGEEIGIPAHSRKVQCTFRQVYRLAHRVIGISDSVTNWLVESGEVREAKAVRIYNPVELPNGVRARPGEDRARFRLGFVGRFEPVKNPMVLVDAVARLRARSIPAEVRLVGDGSQRRMLSERASDLGVRDYVHILGYQEDPLKYIAECDLYVQPSVSEGFGLALVEAMGCGLPALASAVGGAPEIIAHGSTGWLVQNPDADSIVDALSMIWQRHGELGYVGRAGRAAVKHRFAVNEYVTQIERLYDDLLTDRDRETRKTV